MKRWIKHNWVYVIMVASVIATLIAVPYARNQRGYRAIGGEVMIPFLGLAIVAFFKGSGEFIKNWRKEEKQSWEIAKDAISATRKARVVK